MMIAWLTFSCDFVRPNYLLIMLAAIWLGVSHEALYGRRSRSDILSGLDSRLGHYVNQQWFIWPCCKFHYSCNHYITEEFVQSEQFKVPVCGSLLKINCAHTEEAGAMFCFCFVFSADCNIQGGECLLSTPQHAPQQEQSLWGFSAVTMVSGWRGYLYVKGFKRFGKIQKTKYLVLNLAIVSVFVVQATEAQSKHRPDGGTF